MNGIRECGGWADYDCHEQVDPQQTEQCCGESWCAACYAEHRGKMCHG